MLRSVVCFIAVAGMALAGSKSYRVDVYDPAVAGSTELKAGTYEVSLNGQNAVIRGGKVDSQTPVKVENVDKKYAATSVRYVVVDGKRQVQEIHLGGTKTKLVFVDAAPLP